MEALLAVGVIVASFGVKGWCKVRWYADDPTHFTGFRHVLIKSGEGLSRLNIEDIRANPHRLVVKFSGIDTPEDIRRFAGCELWMERRYAQSLAGGEYYASDLCQCALYFKGQPVGRISAVSENGAQQLLEVTTPAGDRYLIPFIGHFIGDVDLERKRIELKEDYILR